MSSPLISRLAGLAAPPLAGAMAGAGFEVILGGVPVKWRWRQGQPVSQEALTWQLQQLDGPLNAQVALRLLSSYRAAQWQARLVNRGAEPIVLDQVRPLLVRFGGLNDPWRTLTAGGGSSENFYPPRAYRLNERLAFGGEVRVQSAEGGLSSQRHLPLLLASYGQERQPGFWCGLEYSGHWFLTLRHIGDNPFIRGELRLAGLSLAPGESLELPAAHMGFFEGGLEAGTNALRRCIMECISPAPPTDQKAWPPVFYHAAYGLPARVDEACLVSQVARAAELGAEYCVLRPGRVEGSQPELEKLAEAVRKAGMKPGLVLPIELADQASLAVREHSGYFLTAEPSPAGSSRLQLDLSQACVRQWALEVISGWVERLGLGWLRLEYDADPDAFLRRDKSGKLELAYYRGLYALLEELLGRHGGLIIESSAAGGRRIDLATLRRCHLHWASEQTFNPDIVRHMLCRLNRFLPGSLVSSAVAAHSARSHDYGDVDALARFGSALGFAGDIAGWDAKLTARMRRQVELYKTFRSILAGQYYSPLPPPATDRQPDAAEFVSPRGDESVVLIWRMAGQTRRMRIPPAHVAAEKTYLVRPLGGAGRGRRIAGKDLLTRGLSVSLPPHSAKAYVLSAK